MAKKKALDEDVEAEVIEVVELPKKVAPAAKSEAPARLVPRLMWAYVCPCGKAAVMSEHSGGDCYKPKCGCGKVLEVEYPK